jgi:hypothetical protein
MARTWRSRGIRWAFNQLPTVLVPTVFAITLAVALTTFAIKAKADDHGPPDDGHHSGHTTNFEVLCLTASY